MAAATTRRVIGVIGGIASGKSLVTEQLRDLGATVIDADSVAHEVLRDPGVLNELRTAFGEDVIFRKKDCRQTVEQVDRKKMAGLVFGDSELHRRRLHTLEGIVQPRIHQRLHDLIEAWKSEHRHGFLALDIPLLFERNWDRVCDEVWFVDTPQEHRERYAAARGWTPEQLRTRESAQLSIEEKRRRSTRILENRGSIQDLQERVQSAYQSAFGAGRS